VVGGARIVKGKEKAPQQKKDAHHGFKRFGANAEREEEIHTLF